MPDPVLPRWSGLVIVAASGPSLTQEVADQCRNVPCLAINDAYRMLPWADIIYAADWRWWHHHKGCPDFAGEKWVPCRAQANSAGTKVVKEHGLRLVRGEFRSAFSLDPAHINFGAHGCANSGFQGINLAILLGGNPIVLVGYDMKIADGLRHFFGNHPQGLNQRQNFPGWINGITEAAKTLPPHITVMNATPGSALKCFPMVTLQEALNGGQARSRVA